jgi:endonuclease/exonuclease/phosphatase family metal-dependent hydrolase
MTGRIRIASYNIHKAQGLDGRVDVARITEVLREVDADVIALQEVVSHDNAGVDRHQARYLADRLERHFSIGETRKHLGGAYGNVTLSRWKIESARHIDVSVPGREPRGILRTDLDVGGRWLHVFNAHLGTGFFERRRQAARLIEEKHIERADLGGPRAVVGDFNEWTRGRVSAALRDQFRDSDSHLHLRPGYPGVLPMLALDHAYFDRELKIESVRLHRSKLSLIASDHLPLVADLVWDGSVSI